MDPTRLRARASTPARPSRRTWLLPLAVLATALSACPEDAGDDDTNASLATPPLIEHTPVADGQVAGEAVEVRCAVTDEEGVGSVTLFVRVSGTSPWAARFFSLADDGTGQWVATIEGSTVSDAGVDYYIKATDIGDPRGEATSPDGAPEQFHTFTTRVVGGELPFVEDFEGETDLETRGWTVYNQGFPHYDWETTDEHAFSGDRSVWHSDGISGLAGPLQDWLVFPPISMVGATEVSVSWFERGLYTSELETHALYVSTGSGDPWVAGEFVPLVEALPAPPEGQWGASLNYDLSAFAGSEVVYLAFYYEGSWPADRWFIDDVYVGVPRPRFQVDSFTADPPDFGPGDAVSISVGVKNVSDVDSPALTATLATTDPQVQVTAAESTYAAIPAGAVGTSEGAFAFQVDAAHPDNAYLDFTVTVTSGGEVYALPMTVTMGQASTATVTADALDSGALVLRLGAGDPAAPAWETEATASADGASWVVDVTPQAALLPPGAGDARWFLEARNDGLYDATVTGFAIEWGGTTFTATGTPAVVPAHESVLLRVPDPPVFVASSVTTDPSPVSPGDSGVSVWVTVENQGAATAGPLTGMLGSDDPDANVTVAGPATFSDAPVDPGGSASSATPFEVSVDAGHRDDSPLALVLSLTDGVESWDVPVDVAVPYAHPQIVSVSFDDGFSGDGYIDRGEDIELDVELQNVGAGSTQGPVTVTLEVASGSEADGTFADATETFGATALAPGEGEAVSSAFEMTVDQGYMGDELVIQAELTDGVDTWTQELRFEVAARPWVGVSGSSDDGLDAGGYMLDLAGASYRSDGEVLWIRVDSWTPFDPETVFLDIHLYNSPTWWVLEYVYEEFRLREGYLYGDEVEPALPLRWIVDDRSIAVRVALDDMEIIGHSTSLGFASGFCAYTWFCDISPDDWFAFDFEAGTIGFYSDALLSIAW